MNPIIERRKKTILDWLVPALLGLIGVLVTLGAISMNDAIKDSTSQTRGLREDIASVKAHLEDSSVWQGNIERRVANLEQDRLHYKPQSIKK